MSIAKSRKKHLDYAKKRESERLLWINRHDRKLNAEINEIMNFAMESILRESQAWLVNYAMTENISLVEARKRVSLADMDYLERKAEKYVAEKDFSPRANQEMRLYNYTMKMSRHELLLRHMNLELLGAYSDVDKLMASYLSDMSTEELIRQAGLLGKSVKGIDQYAKQIANSSFHGATFSDRIWENQKVLTLRLGEGLTKALKTGKHPTSWMKDLREHLTADFSGATYALKRLAVTESARVQIEAQKAAYEANGYSRFMVICEPTACELCTPFDGKVEPVKTMMVGANAPPFHPNCKCSTSAYMDDEVVKDNEKGYNKISGGISGAITDLQSTEAKTHAEIQYGSIRKWTTDISKIAKNTGYSEKLIQEIKEYLFIDEHDLANGRKRFDPDFAIAQSWTRLFRGEPEPHDFTLIEHEKYERELISTGIPQSEAHTMATRAYNYQREAEEYYDLLKKHQKRKK